MKKTLVTLSIVAVLLITSVAVFADTQSIISTITGLTAEEIATLHSQGIGYGQLIPASIVAKKANLSIYDVIELRKAGKTYYQIATEEGIDIQEYKDEMLNARYMIIDDQVNSGLLTEEQAKAIKENIKTAIDNCDGDGPAYGAGQCGGLGIGGCGMGYGNQGNGRSNGFGRGNGAGRGQGNGFGQGFRFNSQQ